MNDKEYIKSLEDAWHRQQEFIDELLDFNDRLLEGKMTAVKERNSYFSRMNSYRQRLYIMAMKYARLKKQIKEAA